MFHVEQWARLLTGLWVVSREVVVFHVEQWARLLARLWVVSLEAAVFNVEQWARLLTRLGLALCEIAGCGGEPGRSAGLESDQFKPKIRQ